MGVVGLRSTICQLVLSLSALSMTDLMGAWRRRALLIGGPNKLYNQHSSNVEDGYVQLEVEASITGFLAVSSILPCGDGKGALDRVGCIS